MACIKNNVKNEGFAKCESETWRQLLYGGSIKIYKEVLGECGEFLINVSLWFLYVQNQQSAVLYIADLHIIIIMNVSCDLLLTFSRNIFQHKARKPFDEIQQ